MYWMIKWCFEWWLSFYFMLCQSSLLSTVINFVFKDKCWFDESMSVIFCTENTCKEFFYSLSTLILHSIKLENFVMQLKRQSVEAWQNESIIQKRIIPARTQSQDEKLSNQSTMWSTKVRSGHNICCCCLCSFLVQLSSCRVTYENCYKSSV